MLFFDMGGGLVDMVYYYITYYAHKHTDEQIDDAVDLRICCFFELI